MDTSRCIECGKAFRWDAKPRWAIDRESGRVVGVMHTTHANVFAMGLELATATAEESEDYHRRWVVPMLAWQAVDEGRDERQA